MYTMTHFSTRARRDTLHTHIISLARARVNTYTTVTGSYFVSLLAVIDLSCVWWRRRRKKLLLQNIYTSLYIFLLRYNGTTHTSQLYVFNVPSPTIDKVDEIIFATTALVTHTSHRMVLPSILSNPPPPLPFPLLVRISVPGKGHWFW